MIIINMQSQWLGSYSQKFGNTKKHLTVQDKFEINPHGLYNDIDSGIERIKGRKHFSVTQRNKDYL